MVIKPGFAVPPATEAGAHKIRFSDQTIDGFIKQRLSLQDEAEQADVVGKPPRFVPPQDRESQVYAEMMMFTSRSCLHGFRGERYIDAADPDYRISDSSRSEEATLKITSNQRCGGPCLLDGRTLPFCQLDPAPLLKLIYAVLVEAIKACAEHKEPLLPGGFSIKCNAYVADNIEWIPGKLHIFGQPEPTNTFEKSQRWALETLWLNTESRNQDLNMSPEAYNFRKGLVLCRKDIKLKSKYLMMGGLSITQVIYVFNSIVEEYFVTDRDHGRKTLTGQSKNEVRISKDPYKDPADYQSDGEPVEKLL